MTTILIILSLLLYILADYYNWKYKTVGNIRNSELFKWGMIGCIVCAILIPPKLIIIAVWFLWHYPTQQIGQGWLRHRKPLYLGVGGFDRMISWATGGKKWLYILSLVLSLILGLWLYLQYYY
jgi:hypothetical protein